MKLKEIGLSGRGFGKDIGVSRSAGSQSKNLYATNSCLTFGSSRNGASEKSVRLVTWMTMAVVSYGKQT